MTRIAPNEAAEKLAGQIEARSRQSPNGRSRALEWAARLVRETLGTSAAGDASPIVLIHVDQDSRLGILRSDDVLIAYLDEREAHDAITVLPRQNDASEIFELIGGRHLVCVDEDFKGIAENTVSRIAGRAVVIAVGPRKGANGQG